MRSTPASRAMGLVLALGGIALGLAFTVIVAPSVIGSDWPLWMLVTAYFGSLAVGLALGTVSAVAALHWVETRRGRLAKH